MTGPLPSEQDITQARASMAELVDDRRGELACAAASMGGALLLLATDHDGCTDEDCRFCRITRDALARYVVVFPESYKLLGGAR